MTASRVPPPPNAPRPPASSPSPRRTRQDADQEPNAADAPPSQQQLVPSAEPPQKTKQEKARITAAVEAIKVAAAEAIRRTEEMGACTEGLPVSEVWEEFLRGEEFIPGNSPDKQPSALPAPPPPPAIQAPLGELLELRQANNELLFERDLWKGRCEAAEERVAQVMDELMTCRNRAPPAAGVNPAGVPLGCTPDHIWQPRLADEQAQKMEALEQAELAWKSASEERRKRHEALDAAEDAIIHATQEAKHVLSKYIETPQHPHVGEMQTRLEDLRGLRGVGATGPMIPHHPMHHPAAEMAVVHPAHHLPNEPHVRLLSPSSPLHPNHPSVIELQLPENFPVDLRPPPPPALELHPDHPLHNPNSEHAAHAAANVAQAAASNYENAAHAAHQAANAAHHATASNFGSMGPPPTNPELQLPVEGSISRDRWYARTVAVEAMLTPTLGQLHLIDHTHASLPECGPLPMALMPHGPPAASVPQLTGGPHLPASPADFARMSGMNGCFAGSPMRANPNAPWVPPVNGMANANGNQGAPWVPLVPM